MRDPMPAHSNPERDVVMLDQEPGSFWLGAWRNINLIVWHDVITMEAVERLVRARGTRVKALQGKLLSSVYIATANAKPPEPKVREAVQNMFASLGPTVGCAAIVIESAGFGGVMLRSVIAGMLLLAPRHYRVKVFDSVDRTAPWFAENHVRTTSVDVTTEEMLAVLQYARVRCQ